jgi:phosphoribosylaminoimidazolecarboxamide formyltransferase/IMP cyclohydrolase
MDTAAAATGRTRLGVLASGRGTNLQAIIDAIERGELAATIAVVVSDRQDAEALKRAGRHGLEAVWLDPKASSAPSREAARAAYDTRLVALLRERGVDLVVLAGYMRMVGQAILNAFPWRVMNIHPALLPSFPGKDGPRQAVEHGVKVSGCTVHFVDGGVDTGPVILQKAVPVQPGDTPETLAERILVAEHRLYPRAIGLFAEGRLRVVDGRRVDVLPAGERPGPRRRRALLSVHDKTGLVEFARGLVEAGFDLISSGGTARAIAEAGLPVTPVEEVTGFPEMLDGRVKTLHPAIHGGILARRDLPAHLAALEAHGIGPIDLVAVNLYPFQAVVNRLTERAAGGRGDTSREALAEAIENIDIGGPSLVRSAAKNHAAVVVVTDPAQYGLVLEHLRRDGDVPPNVRRALALAAYGHTAYYDAVIAAYLAGAPGAGGTDAGNDREEPGEGEFPDRLVFAYEKASDLRYGENPHQRAAFYRLPLRRDLAALGATLPGATQLQGKELSFNNIGDAEAALRCVEEFTEGPAAVAVKHANPCGAAVGPGILAAYRLCYASDPVSIFGGIVALNRAVTPVLATELAKVFLEVILAPAFEPEALAILARKPDLRLLVLPIGAEAQNRGGETALELRSVAGGLLIQTQDAIRVMAEAWRAVTARRPTAHELQDLWFAWRVCRHVKSNAITVARGGQLLGVGAGQMNRVDSTRLAVDHAGERARGAVLASDAFFPFPDSIEVAAAAGITAIVQPGGSVRDAESVKAADAAGIAMVLTGERHFRH